MITRGIQIAASGMQSLLDMNDTIAHNLANVNTAGFKKSALTFKNIYDARVEQASINSDAKNKDYRYIGNISMGSETNKSIISFTQGTLDRTGNPLDVAIAGDGFFKVQDADGNISYTRNGQFTINNKNKLVTLDGDYVLDVKGKTIDVNLAQYQGDPKDIKFKEKGEISIENLKNQATLQTLAIVDFGDKEGMKSLGNAKFVPNDPATNPELPVKKFTIQQGAIELSNSNTITEMINSINVSRNYETLSKLVKEDATLLDAAINLGRVRL